MFGSTAGTDHRDIDHVVFVHCKPAGQFFSQKVSVLRVFFAFFDLDETVVSINKNDDIFV